MSTNFHDPVVALDPRGNDPATVNDPLGQLDAQITVNTNEIVAARSGSLSLDARIDTVATQATTNAAEIVAGRGGFVSLDARADQLQAFIDAIEADIVSVESEIITGRGGQASIDTRLDLYDGTRSEVINARGGHASLDARMDTLTVSGSNTFATLASPTATATVTVGSGQADAFIDGAPVGYTVAGAVEYRTVVSASGTQIVLSSAPSGTIASGSIIFMVSPSELAMALAGHTNGGQSAADRVEQIAAGAYHPMAFGAVGDGTTDDTAVFSTMLAAIGTDRRYILIDRPYHIETITITSGTPFQFITLIFQPGGMLIIPDTEVVTIRGTIMAGPYKIFHCEGNVLTSPATVGRVNLDSADLECVYPEWWGAHEDADATPAILRCIYSAVSHVIVMTGFYVIQTPIDINLSVASTVRIRGTVRGTSRGIIACIENGYVVGFNQGYNRTGGGFTGDYMFRMDGQCYFHIEDMRFIVLGDIINANLEVFSVTQTTGAAALELSYLKNCSFDAYKNSTGPTIKCFINIVGAGPLLIDGLNCMYGNNVYVGIDPTEYGSITSYPISINCSNGLTIRNVNYLIVMTTVFGVRITADSWCMIDGWWYENCVGGGVANFVLSSFARGAIQMRGVRFHTGRQITAGDIVLFEYAQVAGGIIGFSDWDFTQIYWNTTLDATDVVLRVKDAAGSTLATYLAGDLYTAAVAGGFQGIARLSRHEIAANGYGSAMNNGRAKQIDQSVTSPLSNGSTFDIWHDPQLMPIATTAGSGCYLLSISARDASNVSAGYLAFIDFAHSAPSVNVTEIAGAGNFSVAYNAGTAKFRVTNTNGGNLFNVAYNLMCMTSAQRFTNT